MKIKLIVTQAKGIFPNIEVTHTVVNSYQEAVKVLSNCIDSKTYDYLQVLGSNKAFENKIELIRKNLNIPQGGYSYSEWIKFKQTQKNNPSYPSWRNKLTTIERNQIINEFKIPTLLHNNIEYIIIGSFIFLPLTRLYVEKPNTLMPVYDGPEVKVVIQGRVSKNQLIKFIEDNWKDIETNLHIFSNDQTAYISDRDLEITNMRDIEKMKFKQIADRLTEKYNDYEINEDMVKTAYKRAKDKIKAVEKK